MGTAHLSVRGVSASSALACISQVLPSATPALGRNIPAFIAMKDDRPALMAHPDVCLW